MITKNCKKKCAIFGILGLSLFTFQSGELVHAAAPAAEAALKSAYALYTQQKYAQSADAFEALIRTSAPSPRLYYYAALANKAAGRIPRAQQLAQYVATNFGASAEAPYAEKLFAPVGSVPASAGSNVASLPAHLKGKSVDELMQTEEGRQALSNALSTPSAAATATPTKSSSGSRTSSSASSRPRDAAFTAEIIAAEGADGIIPYVKHPDAGFECSLAAMAMLPRGREILANMIRCPSSQDIYVVNWPNNAGEYQITPQKMETYRMKDKALWATIIHGAVRETHIHSWEQGLSLLTGHTAEKVIASNTTQQALAQFIGDAIKKQYPIVCISSDSPNPEVIEEFAGYTITGFDAASGMVTMRNPHGANSRRFRLETDPDHKKFEQLNDGYFKLNVSLFPTCIKEIAKSPI